MASRTIGLGLCVCTALGSWGELAHAEPATTTPRAPCPCEESELLVPPAFARPPPPPPSYWNTERIVGWSSLSAAAVSGGFALYFYEMRRDARNRYEDSVESFRGGDELVQITADYDRANTAFVVATSAATVFALFGAGCLLHGGPSEPTLAARPELVIGPAGARLGFSGHF